jgi:hypothetical protein
MVGKKTQQTVARSQQPWGNRFQVISLTIRDNKLTVPLEAMQYVHSVCSLYLTIMIKQSFLKLMPG